MLSGELRCANRLWLTIYLKINLAIQLLTFTSEIGTKERLIGINLPFPKSQVHGVDET